MDPIVAVTVNGNSTARLNVDESIRDDASGHSLQRLCAALSIVCETTLVWTPDPDAETSFDVRIRTYRGAARDCSWLTALSLNQALHDLQITPLVEAVNPSVNLDMVVNLVLARPATSFIARYLQEAVPSVSAWVIPENAIYNGRVIQLLVPRYGLDVDLDTLTAEIGSALSFTFA